MSPSGARLRRAGALRCAQGRLSAHGSSKPVVTFGALPLDRPEIHFLFLVMRVAAAPVLVGLAVAATVGCGGSSARAPPLTGIDITVPAAAAPIMGHGTGQTVGAGTDPAGKPLPAGQA